MREFSARGESIYSVDAEALRSLSPDLIITQNLCHVCAASPEDLAAILVDFEKQPEVLCLNPLDLGDVWRDILWVGEQTFRGHAAEKLIDGIGQKLGAIEEQLRDKTERPTVAFLEWLQPLYVSGHWVPEMIDLAGGRDVFGKKGTPSFRVTLDQVVAAQPEVLILAPCGYSSEQARAEYHSMDLPAGWQDIPARTVFSRAPARACSLAWKCSPRFSILKLPLAAKWNPQSSRSPRPDTPPRSSIDFSQVRTFLRLPHQQVLSF